MRKNKIESIEEFEDRLKQQYTPMIGSSNPQQMIENQFSKRNNILPLLLRGSLIGVLLVVTATASIAFASQLTGFSFFNKNEEEIYTMETMSEEEAKPHKDYDAVYSNYRITMEKIKDNIPTGKFKYFLVTKGYEEFGLTGLTMLQKGEKIYDPNKIPNEYYEVLNLNDAYVNGIKFSEGTIRFEYPEEDRLKEVAKQMYRDGKDRGIPWVTKEGNLTKKVSSISLQYEGDRTDRFFESISISISPAGNKMTTTKDLTGYERESIKGIDYIYKVVKDEKFHRNEAYFVRKTDKGKYLVGVNYYTNLENVNLKDELLAIGEDLIK